MSYARFSDDYSDVYVYLDVNGYLRCCACLLDGPNKSEAFFTTADMLAHLAQHVAAGHKVPEGCIDGLNDEAAMNDVWIASVRTPAETKETGE